MPVVPISSGPQVTRTALRTGQLQKVSPSQLTGAARQQQALGGTVSTMGATINEIEIQQQAERNTSQVLAAKTAFEAEAATVLTNAKNTRGANAWGVTDKTTEWYQKSSQQHVDNMENEAQKTALRKIFAEKFPGIKAGIYGHEIGEQRRAVNDSAKASIQASIDLASSNFTDPTIVEQALTDITRTVRVQQATNEGWTKDVADVALMEHTTALHKGIIDAKLDVDPAAAEAHFKKYEKQIGGGERGAIRKKLALGNRIVKAQEFTEWALDIEGMDERAALKEARKQFEGKDEEVVTAEIVRRFSRQQAAFNRDRVAAIREAQTFLFDEENEFQDMPVSLQARLDSKTRREMADPNYGKETDYVAYYGLRAMAGSNDPEVQKAFTSLDMEDYFGNFDPVTRKEMIRLHTAAKRAPQGRAPGSTVWQKMQRAAAAANHDTALVNKPGGDTADGRKADRLRAFYARIDTELAGMEGASPIEIDKIIQKVVAEENQDAWNNNWWNTQERLSEIDIPGVPGELVLEYANALAATGSLVSDDNIREMYEEDVASGRR